MVVVEMLRKKVVEVLRQHSASQSEARVVLASLTPDALERLFPQRERKPCAGGTFLAARRGNTCPRCGGDMAEAFDSVHGAGYMGCGYR